MILLLLMTGAVSVVRALVRNPRPAWGVATAVTIVALTVLDGVTPYAGTIAFQFREGDDRLRAARAYGDRVNAAVPATCGVLQLPYVPFPEKAAAVSTMEDYEHFFVALANPGKQWSYGGVKYTAASHWAANLADDLTQESVASLVEGGFCGVHLDRTGYSAPGAAAAEASLDRLLGPPAAQGGMGRWLFYVLPTDGRQHDVRDRQSLSPRAERFFYPRASG
jgi:hypothetical protein